MERADSHTAHKTFSTQLPFQTAVHLPGCLIGECNCGQFRRLYPSFLQKMKGMGYQCFCLSGSRPCNNIYGTPNSCHCGFLL